MLRLFIAALAGLAIVISIWLGWLDVSAQYKWADAVKRELESDGFRITHEQQVGDLALPWTWIHAPTKQVGFQKILATDRDGLVYGVDGYLRLDSDDRTEHAAWLRKIDCQGKRFAQLSLDKTEEVFESIEQIEAALGNAEWVSRASVENKARWQTEWVDRVLNDYCS